MYKKGIGILFILSIVFILGACSSGDLETREFEIEQNGVSITMTYHHDGDKVKKQTTENVIPYASLGVSSKDEAKDILEPESEKLQGIEGITEEIEYGDSEATETLEADYDKLDTEEVKDLPGSMFEGNVEDGISMKKSAEMLKEQGFEEK